MSNFCKDYTNSQLRKMRGVYSLTFPNGKRYVGYTTAPSSNLAHRWTCHKKDAKDGNGHLVHNAIRKYGWKNVIKEVILVSDDEERCQSLEKQLIAFWKLNARRFKDAKGYNLTDGGDGCSGPTGHIPSNKGVTGVFHHTDEAKKLIGKRSIELWQDEDYRETISNKMKEWHKDNPEHCEKLKKITRELYKKYNYEFYLDNGEVLKPKYWREFMRDYGYTDANIKQMLKGLRPKHKNIIRIKRYTLDGCLESDSKINRQEYLKERKEYLKENKKPNKGCRYIVREPNGDEVTVQHLSKYCESNGFLISSLMRKYKGTYRGVRGYTIVKKIGW